MLSCKLYFLGQKTRRRWKHRKDNLDGVCFYQIFIKTVIPRLTSFRTYVFCHQIQRNKLRAQILCSMLKITVTGWAAMIGNSRRGSSCISEVKSSWRSRGPWIWSWGQAHDVLKLTEGLGHMMFRKWLRVLGLLKVASRSLRSFTRMRQDKTRQDKTDSCLFVSWAKISWFLRLNLFLFFLPLYNFY